MNTIPVCKHDKGLRLHCLLVFVLLISAGLVRPGIALGSAQTTAIADPAGQCGGNITGLLGITRLECSGNCTLNFDDATQKWAWSFSVEPQISEISPNSPAVLSLRVGDTIVAIDRYLITTIEGGRQFANITPGQSVTIRYRRDGRVEDAVFRAGSRCAPAVEGIKTLPSAEPSISSSSGSEKAGAAPPSAEASAGISFACGPCSSKSFPDGRQEWNFSAPITVIKVWAGGPAERAGIRAGDLITAVNGNPIESKLGSESFANLRRGQSTPFTVVRPDGSWQNLAIVPAIVINLRETPEQSTKADRSRAQATAKKTAPGVSYGEIGIGLSCGGCSTTYYRANGRTLYEFTSPIEVVGLAPDGPAEKSGIRKGDRITAVDGNPIGSKKGSKAFSNLQAGKATKLTILRNGSILTLTVVPAPKETK